jgi:peptide-methionine (R)-S-oxide reductase
MMQRRNFIATIAAAPLACLGLLSARDAPGASKDAIEDIRRNWRALLAKNAEVAVSQEPLARTNELWKSLLTPPQYQVLREEGTERAFTSPLNAEKRPGVFACAGCSLPLFTSQMKYESGTGWPSFFTSIPDHLALKKDFKLIVERDEYHCVRCGGHQGHLFDDGPPPTRQRWCNNGVALRFIPA